MTPHEEAKIRSLARTLRAAIFSGQYTAGEQLPTRAAMAKSNGVSTQTIGNVMLLLASEGLVRLEQGRGTFVQPVRRYEGVAVIPRSDDTAPAKGRGKVADRAKVQADDDAAIENAAVIVQDGMLEILLTVVAADSGRAASRTMAVARYACQEEDGWDLSAASVEARPADGDWLPQGRRNER